ncbi:MAG: S53 family peptidase [Planctomycetota bacterium]
MRPLRYILLALSSLLIAPFAAGAQEPATTGQIILGLKRDRIALERAANAVADPASPRYADYHRSVRAVGKTYGASASTAQTVLSYLRGRGIRASLDPTRLFVRAEINAEQADEIFGVSTNEPEPGLLIATGPAKIPAQLRGYVTEIEGLVILEEARLEAIRGPNGAGTGGNGGVGTSTRRGALTPYGGSSERTGTARGCADGLAPGGYTPNQLRTAYGFVPLGSAGFRGQDRHVVLFEQGQNFPMEAVEQFAECFSLDMPTIIKRPVGIGALPSEEENVEVLLDITGVMGALPKLDRMTVLIGRDLTPFPAILAAGLDPARVGSTPPDVISVSYGICETAVRQTKSQLFGSYALWDDVARMAGLVGTSVVVSTGDSGSSACMRNSDLAGSLGAGISRSVAYPAGSAAVTAVGGTNIVLNNRNRIIRQRPWNTRAFGGVPYLIATGMAEVTPEGLLLVNPQISGTVQNLGAGTGGTSTMVRAPHYQRGVAGTMRIVPDVAMVADERPGMTTIGTLNGPEPAFGTVGGTSYAAPLFAAQIAAANQFLNDVGKPNVGFANPLLYASAQGTAKGPSPMIDVVGGNNDLASIGCCTARRGFDQATGWGGVNASKFAQAAFYNLPNRR